MNADSDAQLIQRAGAGDARAFEVLVNRHYGTMFKMAFKWCRNRADAEDVTQNACIKLARALKTYEHKAAFTTWLYRLVINTAIDMAHNLAFAVKPLGPQHRVVCDIALHDPPQC